MSNKQLNANQPNAKQSNAKQTILTLSDKNPIILAKMQGWPAGQYKLSPQHVGAIQAAYLSKRPLLVRGGPGLGKSQLAQAVASLLGWGLVSTVIHYNTTVEDLLYGVDHVQRLDEANRNDTKVGELANYVKPGKVWQAIAPASLQKYHTPKPHNQPGTVLLIDEIDKADPSLPNALLEVLANGAISVPYFIEAIAADKDHPCFVLITSNDERLLPQAFLRRCAVLNLQLPEDRDKALIWMEGIFASHFPNGSQHQKLATQVAEQVLNHRDKVKHNNSGDYLPGTSEFLDMLHTLMAFTDPKEQQDKLVILSEHLIEKSQFRKA